MKKPEIEGENPQAITTIFFLLILWIYMNIYEYIMNIYE